MLEHKPDAVGIRVGVTKRGCNGMSYTMNYATEKKKFDEKVEDKGTCVRRCAVCGRIYERYASFSSQA